MRAGQAELDPRHELQRHDRRGTVRRGATQTTLQGSTSFNITPKWAAQWQTTYDFQQHNFASQVVSLQRDLHDWRAIFSFTQSPTGSFAFSFFVALKAEPALKFNYDKQTYRSPGNEASGQTY